MENKFFLTKVLGRALIFGLLISGLSLFLQSRTDRSILSAGILLILISPLIVMHLYGNGVPSALEPVILAAVYSALFLIITWPLPKERHKWIRLSLRVFAPAICFGVWIFFEGLGFERSGAEGRWFGEMIILLPVLIVLAPLKDPVEFTQYPTLFLAGAATLWACLIVIVLGIIQVIVSSSRDTKKQADNL